MLQSLSQKLQETFKTLRNKGHLSEADVRLALAQIRLNLLEADVALPVVKKLTAAIQQDAVGKKILESIQPGEQVIKIMHDHLVNILTSNATINKNNVLTGQQKSPHVVMMVGLQGSGKTTSAVKLAKYLNKHRNHKILVASLDIYRPAAQEQLKIFANKNNIDCLAFKKNEAVAEIASRALQQAKKDNYDYLFLDTAGRLTIDKELMEELRNLKKTIKPEFIILVLDALSGQSAITTATGFHNELGLTGAILSRMDGDARGGAALSLTHETGCPLLFLGTGEQADKLELFEPTRMANQILGMGDIVSLVEKAQELSDEAADQAMEQRLKKGIFTLEDFRQQLRKMKKLGGMKEILSHLPSNFLKSGQMANLNNVNLNDSIFTKQEAIINSMTPKERRSPEIILASRKQRIAKGSGTAVADINRLLKQFLTTQKMMKQASKMDPALLQRQMSNLRNQMGRKF